MTKPLIADVEIVLDLREYLPVVTGEDEFLKLWNDIEPLFAGVDLGGRSSFRIVTDTDGVMGVEVARFDPAAPFVGSETRFSVVAVRERPRVRYPCRVCEATGTVSYGPFTCQECMQANRPDRVCDDHVMVLDGALTPTCPDHRPICAAAGCGRSAEFRCAGTSCRARTGWCGGHRRAHPGGDRDVAFCPSCYDERFPVCEVTSCQAIGTVACEYVTGPHSQCGRRSCTAHAHRWKVYGSERVGLGLCREHRVRRGMSADEVLRQIVYATLVRRPYTRLPTLAGFAHTLRNTGHGDLALRHRAVADALRRLYTDLQRGGMQIRDAGKQLAEFDRAAMIAERNNEEGEQIVGRLRDLVLSRGQRSAGLIANGLSLAQYMPPTEHRPGLLFVELPQDLRGLFAANGGMREYGQRLGVQIRFEGEGRRR